MLLAFARPEGVPEAEDLAGGVQSANGLRPDPPHKDDGTGWNRAQHAQAGQRQRGNVSLRYKVVARDPGEDKDTEPICSHERLQAPKRRSARRKAGDVAQALERVRREDLALPLSFDFPLPVGIKVKINLGESQAGPFPAAISL